MSVICRKVLLKLALRTWTEKIQAKSEEWTTQTAINYDTYWLQSFGKRNTGALARAKRSTMGKKIYTSQKVW